MHNLQDVVFATNQAVIYYVEVGMNLADCPEKKKQDWMNINYLRCDSGDMIVKMLQPTCSKLTLAMIQ